MSPHSASLVERVEQSLARVGFPGIRVTDLGDGKIRLDMESLNPDERMLARQAARSVSGVISVEVPSG